MSQKFLPFFVAVITIIAISNGCKENVDVESLEDYELAAKWADMTLYITQFTPANSPTYASRCLGYIGLTMYESVVDNYQDYHSMMGQLNELSLMDTQVAHGDYNYQLALNAGQAKIIKLLYNQTSDENKLKIDSLEEAVKRALSVGNINSDQVDRSIAYGQSIADHIFEWAKVDGGHRAYLKNFDKEWVQPEFEGSWKPPLFAQSFSHKPLHPQWGENRTFVVANASLDNPEMIKYNNEESSDYYKQFKAVHEKDMSLTQEEKEIALWWGDDPDDTFTPPGHSYFIASKVVRSKKLSLVESAETYARVGISVADAFINCWKWKYHFFSERPNTFIPMNFDDTWESFWPDPPFPAFPSGHAIQAAAAATVLSDLHGDEFEFIDDSHVDRERDEVRDVDFKARSFTSFWDVALETAESRFYGGIHVPQDNEVGLSEGVKIAGHVNALHWKGEIKR